MPTQEGNVSFRQIRSTHRHGDAVQAQASDGTGTEGHVAVYDAAGNVKDGGLPLIAGTGGTGTGGSAETGLGSWYEQIPNGAKNGVNVDFYLDYVPVTPPTGNPAVVPVILMINGVIQSPYVPRYSLEAGSNHIVMSVPPRAIDEMVVWYFTGPLGDTPGTSTPTGNALLTLWAAYVDAQGTNTAHGSPAVGYSLDGGTTWSDGGLSSTATLPDGLFDMQKCADCMSVPLTSFVLADFRVRAYPLGTLFADAVDLHFEIADMWLTINYANGTIQAVKPTANEVVEGSAGIGDAVDPQFCYDVDSDPPTTFGYVSRNHFSGLSDPKSIVFKDWQ